MELITLRGSRGGNINNLKNDLTEFVDGRSLIGYYRELGCFGYTPSL